MAAVVLIAANMLDQLQFRMADSDSVGAYDSATVAKWFEEGLKELALTAECFIKQTDDVAISAEGVAVIPDDNITVLSAKQSLTPFTWLDPVQPNDFSMYTMSVAAPTAYTVMGESIYTNTLTNTLKIDVIHSYLPTTYVGIPSKYETVLLAYAEYRARDMDRDTTLADRAFGEFDMLRKHHTVNSKKETFGEGEA